MCFVWIWEQTAIISIYRINWLVFITETECVYCAVRTGSLYIILRSAHTVYLRVLCGSENKQRLFLFTEITYRVLYPRQSVYCAVRTGSLNQVGTLSSLRVNLHSHLYWYMAKISDQLWYIYFNVTDNIKETHWYNNQNSWVRVWDVINVLRVFRKYNNDLILISFYRCPTLWIIHANYSCRCPVTHFICIYSVFFFLTLWLYYWHMANNVLFNLTEKENSILKMGI